jgi:hypothetical protein
MKYQVMLFQETDQMDLQRRINVWLKGSDIVLIDIKYQATISPHSAYWYSAMIIYEVK